MADQELIGYDLNFYYLDLTNTAAVRTLGGIWTPLDLLQAEDREFTEIHQVLRAVTTSLVVNIRRRDLED